MFSFDIVPTSQWDTSVVLSPTILYLILCPLNMVEMEEWNILEVYPGHKVNQLPGMKFSVW